VGNSPVGATVRVTVLREGKTQTFKVTLGRREEANGEVEPEVEPEAEAEPQSTSLLGLTLTPLTDDLRADLGLDEGLRGLAVTEVAEDSEAFEKGLRAGDVITEAGQQKVESIGALEERVEAAREAGRKSLLLLVRRAGDPRFVALSLGE
jgi:serine protease Do